MTNEVLESVRAARSDAQDLRRKARGAPAHERSALFDQATARFEGAVTTLKRTLRTLRREQSGYSPDVCRVLEALSQTLGSQGGTYRDARNFTRALELYEEGNRFEEERRRHCGARDSYNLLQRLVVELLQASASGGRSTASALMQEASFANRLQEARQEIERQVDAGRTDSWALADLALVRFLCGEEAGLPIEDLDRRKSEGSFYESAHAVVSTLINEGLGAGEPLGVRLEELQRFLKRKGGLV
jgi:hypothetical protein